MISSKFRRSGGRRPNWSLGRFPQISQHQILASSHDSRIKEYYPGPEEEILGVESSVILVEPKDILQRSARRARSFGLDAIKKGT
jgi:hypothetical protein